MMDGKIFIYVWTSLNLINILSLILLYYNIQS